MEGQSIAFALEEIKKAVFEIPSLSKSIDDVKLSLASIEAKMKEFNVKQTETAQELTTIRAELEVSRKRNMRLEKEIKQTNLMFYNFPQPPISNTTLLDDIIALISNTVPSLKVSKWEFRDAVRLRGPQNPRPILVKFNSKVTRDILLRNTNLFKQKGISVAPDYTPEEREARTALRPLLSQAISKKRIVKLRGTRLCIDKQTFVYDFERKTVLEMAEPTTEKQTHNKDSSTKNHIPRRSYMRSPSSDSDSDPEIESISNSDSDTTIIEKPAAVLDPNIPSGNYAKSGRPKGKRVLDMIISPSNDSKQDQRNVRPNKGPKSEKKRKSHSPKKCGQTLAERPPFVIG